MKKISRSEVLVKGLAMGLAVTWAAACAEQPAAPPPALATAEQAVVTQCPYLDPADPQFYAGPPVRFPNELVITHVNVVDDPCRTSWSAAACGGGGTPGIWTFGEMMRRISGAVPPATVTAEWLHQWEIPIVVNGFPVPPRPNIRPLVIDPWLIASGCAAGSPIVGPGACALNLQRAPFRLLAIVNRTDLECGNYPSVGAGEARMVFGVLNSAGNPIQATVIFEFTLPAARAGTAYTTLQWQHDWHALSSMPLGSPAYRSYLEALMNDITAVGASPGNPNLGSSLGQVRTNEISFGGPPWKLRETRLQNVGAGINAMHLLAAVTAETPDDSLNQSPALDAFLAGNAPLLATFTQPSVPNLMLGGQTSAPLPGPSPFWDHAAPSPLAPIERHHFGFKTCNGCHFQETNTPFLHIGNRNVGAPSALSPFLGVSPLAGAGGLPVTVQTVNDPKPTGAVFQYNEPWRRVCEASRMLQGSTRCWSRGNGAH